MKLLTEISRTIHAIRCAGNVDVERLCFEVSPEEWRELLVYMESLKGLRSRGPVMLSPSSMCVLGITVRRRPS